MRRSSVAQMLLRLAGHGLTLYGWQRRFIDDSSRFRILLKPRGAGATFTIALEALTNALLKPKTTTILLSYSLRQSLEIFRHVKELLEKISSNTVKLNSLPYRLQHTTGQRSTMLGNGSRIISLPNNPETLRGYRADNLYVDEAALFRDDFRIRTAVMFTTVARQGRVVLASTPKGKRGWFYTAWAGEQGWSKHLVTLGECPHISKEDVEGLRRVMSDLEWRQEMECEFLDEANAFIPYEKILECVQDYVPAKPDPGEQAFIGVDFGRYRDSTVIVGVARNPETGLRICYLEELRRKSFDEQLLAILRAVEALHPARVAVDSTGMGAPLAETLSKQVQGLISVTITASLKTTLITNLRNTILQHQITIPADATSLINQLRLFQQVEEGGHIRYGAPPGEHDDHVIALALACYAAQTTTTSKVEAVSFWRWPTIYGAHVSEQQDKQEQLPL
jgi:phage FluMu gp28-like protein